MQHQRVLDLANDLVGQSLIIRGKDYGVVTEVVTVCTGHETRIGLRTDTGKALGAVSVLRYLLGLNKKVEYPEGTAFAHYFSGPKGIYSGKAVGGAQMPTDIRIGVETINMTQHLCSNHVIDGVED